MPKVAGVGVAEGSTDVGVKIDFCSDCLEVSAIYNPKRPTAHIATSSYKIIEDHDDLATI